MTNNIIDDFEIQALVDQQLDWESEKKVRTYLAINPHAMRRYEELRLQRDQLRCWWELTKPH